MRAISILPTIRRTGAALRGLILLAIFASPASSQAAPAPVVVEAAEDSWIAGFDIPGSQGSNVRLGICPVVNYWIYLKFDLRGLSGPIDDAELRMNRTGGNRPEEIVVYPFADDAWDEATMNGATRPAPQNPNVGTSIGTGRHEDSGGYDVWRSSELAAFLREQAAGDGIATLMLREDPDVTLDVRYFHSREGAPSPAERPRLVLTIGNARVEGIVDFLLGDDSAPAGGDVNGDGSIDAADIVASID